MAYFPNGTAGECFDEQCLECKYGEGPCPIYLVQGAFNYEACNNETASKILNFLVGNDGDCAMFNAFEDDFGIDKNQIKMDF